MQISTSIDRSTSQTIIRSPPAESVAMAAVPVSGLVAAWPVEAEAGS